MATRAVLDVTRTELTELMATHHRRASEISVPSNGKNSVYQWPHTGSWTLYPANFTSDYRETKNWEALKFRLADCTYNTDWWTEVPNNTRADVGPSDYFFNAVVKNTNVPSGYPSATNFLLLQVLTDVAVTAAVNTLNFQQRHAVAVIKSKATMMANQGFDIRFRVDGKETVSRGSFLEFQFGEFLLRLSTNGDAELYQSPDFTNYALVYWFPWAHSDEIHGRSHRIIIFPHSRNKIEFRSFTGGAQILGRLHFAQRGTNGGGIYEIPGEYQFDSNGNFQITQAAKWVLGHTREFRAHVQVGMLGWVNSIVAGGNTQSGLYDSPWDFGYTGPTVPVTTQVEYDANGCGVFWNVFDADSSPTPQTLTPWVSDGTKRRIQFGIGFTGLADIAGPVLASSQTPEFYGYQIDKPAGFLTTERDPIELPVLKVQIAFGDNAEAERLTLELANDEGQCEDFEERAEIPLLLCDDETEIVYFEGTAHEVETTECPAVDPGHVRIEALGMADNGLRTHWSLDAPDFGKDPNDAQMRAWLAAPTIRRVFNAEGFQDSQVVIEEESDYLANFRWWNTPTSGGGRNAAGGGGPSSALGDGATAEETPLRRWKPRESTAINEFAEFIIRDVLGWHYYWNRQESRWHVYRRPDPNNALDVSRNKFVPKVEFYDDSTVPTGLYPSYTHSGLRKRTQRPICTTVQLLTTQTVTNIATRTALNAALLAAATNSDSSNAADPVIQKIPRVMLSQPFDNKKGYRNPYNDPPDIGHPDWLGKKRLRVFPAVECCTDDATEWLGRRLYEDYTIGWVRRTMKADWGDIHTAYLRKWDVVLVNRIPHYFMEAEPEFDCDRVKRAQYSLVQLRDDVRAPR